MNGLIVVAAVNKAANGNIFVTTTTGERYWFANKETSETAKIGSYCWAIEQVSTKTYKRDAEGVIVLGEDGKGILIDKKVPTTSNLITAVFSTPKEAFLAKNQALLMKAQEKATLRTAFRQLGEEFELEDADIDALIASA